MTDDPGITTASVDVASASQPRGSGIGPVMVLLLGAWIGLITGFADLGILVINKQFIFRDFYRLGADFPWIIPLGVMVMILAPTVLIALFAWMRGSVRLSVVVGLLSFIAALDLCARIRLENWASLIVCVGCVTQALRLVRPRREAFLSFVRRSFGGLVLLLLAIVAATAGRRAWTERNQVANLPPLPAGKQNVLLIVWDTVRASNTSLHGYQRDTTPNLKKLAGQGTRFDLAFSSSSWTLPSHASMFTGRWPHELGVDWKRPMRDDAETLAERLAAHGYDTAGFVGNLDYCSRETGLARGFVHYEDFPIGIFDTFSRYIALGRRIEASLWTSKIDEWVEKQTGRWYNLIPHSREHVKNADEINDAFLGWLRKRPQAERPFFAFLNFNDAHSPYEVPPTSQPGFGMRPNSSASRQILHGFTGIDKHSLSVEDVRMATDVYDDGIRYLDDRLGQLLDDLKRDGVLDNTLVIVTADHGEHLGDHRLFFHGCSLYRQLVQVPLVIVGKTGIPAGRTVSEHVSMSDLPATVVDVLGLSPDAPFPGQSLARYWQAPGEDGNRAVPPPLLMETTKPELLTNEGREPAAKGPMKSVVAAGMHYILVADGSEGLYNLAADPEEKKNLAVDAETLPVRLQFRNLLSMLLKKR